MVKKIILILFISVQGCVIHDTVLKYQTEKLKQEYTNIYHSLKEKFPWITPKIYSELSKNLALYELTIYEKFNLLKVLTALIDTESTGRSYVTGKLCWVQLNRKGKLVWERHRARGLMQVMPFNTPYAGKKIKQLYAIETNIYYGVKVFMRGYFNSNRNIVATLDSYNPAGPDTYNWTYINKVMKKIENS